MKRIYFVKLNHEKYGEIQAVFDKNNQLMDLWSTANAMWVNKVFINFMLTLGIECLEINITEEHIKQIEHEFNI